MALNGVVKKNDHIAKRAPHLTRHMYRNNNNNNNNSLFPSGTVIQIAYTINKLLLYDESWKQSVFLFFFVSKDTITIQ